MQNLWLAPVNRKSYWPFDIAKVEKKYQAKFMGNWSIKDKDNKWHDYAVSVFYQPVLVDPSHSHYFGMFGETTIFICNAATAFSEPLTGIVAKNGEVVISKYHHDFQESQDRSVWIDGGRSYIRYGFVPDYKPKLVTVYVDEDNFIIGPLKEDTNV